MWPHLWPRKNPPENPEEPEKTAWTNMHSTLNNPPKSPTRSGEEAKKSSGDYTAAHLPLSGRILKTGQQWFRVPETAECARTVPLLSQSEFRNILYESTSFT